MRAIGIRRYGGPEVLERRDLPIPHPGPNEVRVRVQAAGINFMDVHTRQGKYATSTTYPVRAPLTLGVEGAGVVDAVGPGVARLAVGDRVAWCLSWGSYADFAVVPERLIARLPDAVEVDLAAAAMFPGSTAHYLVHDTARLGPGMSCLVYGASGVIGQLLVQLAKRAGATVLAVTSTPERADVVEALGVDGVFLQHGPVADGVRDATGGTGVDVVFDAVGRATLRESMRATRVRGLVVNYGSVSGSLDDLDPIELGEAGSLFLTRPRLADHLQDAETAQRRADDVFGHLLEGTLVIPLAGLREWDEVEAAHDDLEHRRSTGKAVLRVA